MAVKEAYLTIDDAPGKDFRNKVAFLAQHDIPAIFFCVGENILQHEEEVIAAIRRGFVIGNHSWTHPHFSDLPVAEGQQEIRRTDEAIETVYRKSGIARPAKVFRFPFFDDGGAANAAEYEARSEQPSGENPVCPREDRRAALQSFLGELGYRQPDFRGINLQWASGQKLLDGYDVRCTFDQLEYWLNQPGAPGGLNQPAAILARIEADDPENGKALNRLDTRDIILIHDHDPEASVALFYQIIRRYLEKGIRFITPF
ncbi:polysaccharide deacetylase [Hydrogenispora ethanolica]|uniref:Polysaccharide deacetylase n=1 Tax=Hydrogenispora ethanolica TaxID=1082276 RepID=A0A4R1SCI8_HYDET|nr:polysaccharide deacetylase family protein [Hydrogenispora ethanolica]TCL77004.1 polysaccharide deacetylase [Hydrogenispora ethanolica]